MICCRRDSRSCFAKAGGRGTATSREARKAATAARREAVRAAAGAAKVAARAEAAAKAAVA